MCAAAGGAAHAAHAAAAPAPAPSASASFWPGENNNKMGIK